MANRVITIARSYGSGGRKMGKLLAKELGYEYYDREILRIASDDSGISEAVFARADENTRKTLLYKVSQKVYDTSLKAYGDERGIQSYGMVVDLLVVYYKERT